MTIIEPVLFIFLLGLCYDISNIMNVYVKKITHVMVFMIVLRCGNDDDCDDHCLPKRSKLRMVFSIGHMLWYIKLAKAALRVSQGP